MKTTTRHRQDPAATPASGLPHRQVQFLLILAVTVLAFAAIVVLPLAGEAGAAAIIGAVSAATCGLLALRKPELADALHTKR